MKSLLILASLVPNLICDYGNMGNQWSLMGATIDYDVQSHGSVVLKNVSTSETYGRIAGPQSGICATMPISYGANKYIVKIAAYTAADEFTMAEDTCEFSPESLDHKTLAQKKIEVVPGQATQVGSDSLQMIYYSLKPDEVKAWSQSEKAAQEAAEKKCLDLFPGSHATGN